jgi:hypothetical protein
VAERCRQLGPLLVGEQRRHSSAVEVLQRAAARLGANELETVELAQDAHVVADVAQRLTERVGELAGARDAVFAQALQDPEAEAMGEGFGEPLF